MFKMSQLGKLIFTAYFIHFINYCLIMQAKEYVVKFCFDGLHLLYLECLDHGHTTDEIQQNIYYDRFTIYLVSFDG